MAGTVADIEWDDGNSTKCQKHGVTLHEIEDALASEFLAETADPHPDEVRVRAVGTTTSGRHVFIVYTLRKRAERTYIRPISARFMHRKEVESYEKQTLARLPDR